MGKITRKQILSKLEEVLDPELNISIVDLGLVYKIESHPQGEKHPKDVNVRILMTLTTVGCPLFNVIEEEIKHRLAKLGIGQNNIKIEVTFDPPWSIDKMTKRGKAMLGI